MLIKAPFRFFIKAGYVFVPGFCNYALYFAVMLIYWISPQKLLYMMFGGKMLKYAGYLEYLHDGVSKNKDIYRFFASTG